MANFMCEAFTFLLDNIFFYYIQMNEIQEHIDEITGIFQKVVFSPVTNIKVLFH